jgi:hypothetical protein
MQARAELPWSPCHVPVWLLEQALYVNARSLNLLTPILKNETAYISETSIMLPASTGYKHLRAESKSAFMLW